MLTYLCVCQHVGAIKLDASRRITIQVLFGDFSLNIIPLSILLLIKPYIQATIPGRMYFYRNQIQRRRFYCFYFLIYLLIFYQWLSSRHVREIGREKKDVKKERKNKKDEKIRNKYSYPCGRNRAGHGKATGDGPT